MLSNNVSRNLQEERPRPRLFYKLYQTDLFKGMYLVVLYFKGFFMVGFGSTTNASHET